VIPYSAGAAYNHGGITGSGRVAPRPCSAHGRSVARADPKTGTIKIRANVRNASPDRGPRPIGVHGRAGG